MFGALSNLTETKFNNLKMDSMWDTLAKLIYNSDHRPLNSVHNVQLVPLICKHHSACQHIIKGDK